MKSQNAIAVLILIILLVTSGYFLLKNLNAQPAPKKSDHTPKQNILPTPSPLRQALDSSPSAQFVVENFYKSYQNCLEKPPPQAKDNVSIYCQKNNKEISNSFFKNLEKRAEASKGADPIVCAQNLPQSIMIEKIVQDFLNQASVYVQEKWGSSKPTQVKSEVIFEENRWKVNDISCPTLTNL